MESKESQISVWVCREEKLVLGLSKRTTCADVVQVLLEEQKRTRGLLLSSSSSSSSSSSTSSPAGAQSYSLVEKWRGLERVLPLDTRILRLWTAWGEERSRVRFMLVRNEAAQAARGARSAEARVVPSSVQGPRAVTAEPAACPVSPEKQRRVVRKAFRKLEKMNRSRRRTKSSSRRPQWDEERMETLVHQVLSQDHTIRQQLQRLSELDQEIERCEAQVHLDRVQRHGVNYLQDMYLTETFEEFEEYVQWCEELVRLQEQLWEQEALTDVMSVQVQEELNQRWMQRRTGELPLEDETVEDELLLEAERVRTELEASSYIGLRLNTDLEAIRSDLELTQEICMDREKEMRDLMEKVNSLELGSQDGAEDETGRVDILESKSEWVEQARGLGKAQSGNDDDSDTGLSSLHSQDSDSLPVWESLV